jgi:hypothetical protein
VALQSFLQDLMTQNDRLETFNEDLVTLVSFLNSTSLGLGNSLEDITDFLSSQIDTNQMLVLKNLENIYRQRIQNWDCDFRDVFRDEAFGNDFTSVIERQAKLPAVLDYIDRRIFQDLCLDVTNFESYLDSVFPTDGSGESITTYRLIREIVLYTDLAWEYYFSASDNVVGGGGGGGGVPLDDWVDASFKCVRLDNPYVWRAS